MTFREAHMTEFDLFNSLWFLYCNEKIGSSTIEKYIELNILHPFREGNGRSMRVWLDNTLSNKFNKVVNWSNINSNEYLNAIKKSVVDSKELNQLILNNLIDDNIDEYILFKNIDKSYEYEDMYEFKTKDL